jgi:hypothetical protein
LRHEISGDDNDDDDVGFDDDDDDVGFDDDDFLNCSLWEIAWFRSE